MSGLSAGATLKKTLPGASVRILEARTRIGGRISTAWMPVDPREHQFRRTNSKANTYDANCSARNGVSSVVSKTAACSVDLGAAYVHGCNETNSVWRLAVCTEMDRDCPPCVLDTTGGGYSVGWGDNCVWRTSDGRVLNKNVVRRAFHIAWRVKREVEYPSADISFGSNTKENTGQGTISGLEKNNSAATQYDRKSHVAVDHTLRQVVDAALQRTVANLKRPLTEDMCDVLRSAEVLIWSYVSTMDQLSTQALRETVEPLPAETGDEKSSKGHDSSDYGNESLSDRNQQHSHTIKVHRGGERHDQVAVSLGETFRNEAHVAAADTVAAEDDKEVRCNEGNRDEPNILDDKNSAMKNRSRAGRLRRETRLLTPDVDSRRKRRRNYDASQNDEHASQLSEQLTWSDGLVVHGYYDLVPRQLAKGLHIETGRVVRKVEWDINKGGRRVCRVFSDDVASVRRPNDDDCDPTIRYDNEQDEQAPTYTDECDYIIVALPLGVLKNRHPTSSVEWCPPLPKRKRASFDSIGFGAENKVILRFNRVFWEPRKPYIQTVKVNNASR